MSHRSDQLRDAGCLSLPNSTDAAVVYQRCRPWQDGVKGQVVGMQDSGGEFAWKLLPVLREQDASPAEDRASLNRRLEESGTVFHGRYGRENDRRIALAKELLRDLPTGTCQRSRVKLSECTV